MKNIIWFESSKDNLKIGSKSLDVFVLENNLRVISIKSIQKALGYEGKNENWMFEFLKEISIYLPIPLEILMAYQTPIKIYNSQKDNSNFNAVAANVLKDTFQLIVKAKNEGFLNANQIKFSKEAKLLLEDKNIDILKKVIDHTLGFNLFKENIINKMILTLQENDLAYIWVKTFPDDFFELLMEMKNLNWKIVSQNPENFEIILNETVFSRLDPALLEELRVLKPKRTYQRKNSAKQDVEHPKLKQHLGILFSLAKVSGYNYTIFMQLLNKSFPEQKKRASQKIKQNENNPSRALSNFDKNLLKAMFFKSK